VRSEKFPKPFQGIWLDNGMSSAFSFAKAVDLVRGTLRVADDARKTFVAVEAEMLVGDDAGQSEEQLEVGEHACRVGDQSLSADEVKLIDAELGEPAAHVNRVQSYLYSSPGRVHRGRRVSATAVGVNER